MDRPQNAKIKRLDGQCAHAELILARLHLQPPTKASKRSISRWRAKLRKYYDSMLDYGEARKGLNGFS